MSTKILVSLSARKACFALFERGGLSGFTAYDNDDRALRAGLYNISLHNTREDIIRAFLEGIAFNTRSTTCTMSFLRSRR